MGRSRAARARLYQQKDRQCHRDYSGWRPHSAPRSGVELARPIEREAPAHLWDAGRSIAFQDFRGFAQNYGSDIHPESQQRSLPNREIDGMLHDEWEISLKP